MHVHSEPSPGIVTFIIAFYYPSKPPSIHAHWNRFLLTFNSTLSIAFFCFSLRLHWFTSHMSQVFYFSWFFKSHCQTTIPPPLAASTWSTDNICCGPKYAEVNQPKPLLDRRARIWTTWFGLIYSVYFKLSTCKSAPVLHTGPRTGSDNQGDRPVVFNLSRPMDKPALVLR